MHKNVEVIIGRLATNPGFRKRFTEQPLEALREQGLELSEIEIRALAAIRPEAFRAFAAAIDARLRRASVAVESRPLSGATETQSHSTKETQR